MEFDKSFGKYLMLSVKGTSHAKRMTFALENFPSGFKVDEKKLVGFMARRSPGKDALSSSRKEPDAVVFSSGISSGITTGGKIEGVIESVDAKPKDYGEERTIPRPGHADFPQYVTEGRIPTGGGKNSARLTAPLCAAGSICLQYLEERGIKISACVESVRSKRDEAEMIQEIEAARDEGDSVGGTIVCKIEGVPTGLGGPLWDGLECEISSAMFSIPGVKGIEFGGGFACATMRGSEFNDEFEMRDGQVRAVTNRQGGILGGMASGMPIVFRLAMRPTPTIFKEQNSVDLKTLENAKLSMRGRHDPCIVRRAVPVVEAMAAYSIADELIRYEATHSRICLTLTGKTIEECLAQYKSQQLFADLAELRVDLLNVEERAKVAVFPQMVKVPVILTFRRKCDGGAFEGNESERVAFFKQALTQTHSCAGFAYVDFEDDFRNDELDETAKKAGVKIIRSYHDFNGSVTDIVSKMKAMRRESNETIKVAFMPATCADVERMFEGTKDFNDFPHVICAMGEKGLASRVLAVKSHSLWTYGSVAGLGSIGHITPHELVRKYRIRSVTSQTRVVYVNAQDVEETNRHFAIDDEDVIALPEEVRP